MQAPHAYPLITAEQNPDGIVVVTTPSQRVAFRPHPDSPAQQQALAWLRDNVAKGLGRSVQVNTDDQVLVLDGDGNLANAKDLTTVYACPDVRYFAEPLSVPVEAVSDEPAHSAEVPSIFRSERASAEPAPTGAPLTHQQPTAHRAERASFITHRAAEPPAQAGWRGTLNHMGFKLAPGPDEREERADTAEVSQHWPGPRTIAVANPKGSAGKAIEVSEPVLTPTGFRPIGDLAVGDLVVGSDGLTYPVLGVFPQGERDLFDVELSDGTIIRADADHLWEVETCNERLETGECIIDGCARKQWCRELCSAHYGQWSRGVPFGPVREGNYTRVDRTVSGKRLMTTAELDAAGLIRNHGTHGGIRHYYFISPCQPVKFDYVTLPVDPYLLGLLLGDGALSSGQAAFSTADAELAEAVQARLPEGCWLRYKDRYDYRVVRTAPSGHNPLTDALRALGLWGSRSNNKSVPDLYKYADADARLQVLQGLLDTDGWVVRDGIAAGFCSVSPQLAADVKFLAESLGCVVTASDATSTVYTHNGETKPGQPSYRLRIAPPHGIDLFRLTRKADAMRTRVRQPWRAVHSVTPAGRGQAVCISVASPDQLFLTRNFVPTHNTPTSVMLSAVFARYGGAGVLAWDNNETRGSLPWRTQQANHSSTVLNLLPQVEDLLGTHAQSAQMSHWVHHQPADKYDVLWSDQSVEGDHVVSAHDVDDVWRVACRYYRMIVVDSGNSERAPNWRAMMQRANTLVVPMTNVEDTPEAGALMLDALRARDEHSRGLAERAVAIVSQRTPGKDPNMDRICRDFAPLVREVVRIPFDPALKSGIIHFDALQPATQRAWLRAAAAVARGL